MKKGFFFIIGLCIAWTINCQEVSCSDLISWSSLSLQKFEQAVAKKGFSKAELSGRNQAVYHVYRQKIRDSAQALRIAERFQAGKEQFLVLKTSSYPEFVSMRQQLKTDGFFCGLDSFPADGSEVVLQKKNVIVQAGRIIENADTLYGLRFHFANIPHPSAIQYADDLLQFTSHQFLISMFGAGNVMKDIYFFNDNEINACSVLFPNTSRQAVFIWKDETNLKDLSSVIVGGGLHVGGDINYASHIIENSWTLRNGMRPNMRLRELMQMNGADFQFYGKESPYYLKVKPDADGAVNFKTTSVVLGCLNCTATSFLDTELVSAEEAMSRNLALHVQMLILSPFYSKEREESREADKR
jgi:hypothetical protein